MSPQCVGVLAVYRVVALRSCWFPQSGSKMANFKVLQPYFAEAGVPVSTKDIRDIITEQRSSATKVLFQLRTVNDKAATPKPPSRPSGEATKEWKRETAADLVSDPKKRADIEFIRRAIEGGA